MTELEFRLSALGPELDFPETPDLAERVGAAITMPRQSLPRLRLRLAVALAVVLATGGAVLAASPGARSAFLELFGIGGVQIVRVGDVSPAAARLVPFGSPATLAEAQRLVGFRIRLPDTGDGRPVARVFLDRSFADGFVSIVWCCDPRIVLSQFRGNGIGFLRKEIGPGTIVEEVEVDGKPGFWVDGAEHTLRAVDRNDVFHEQRVRVTGGVLIWEEGDVTLRLEGEFSQSEALEIARELD